MCSRLSVFCHFSKISYEALAIRYGSPTIDDIEAYTIALRANLDDAESAGTIPQNISLEVGPLEPYSELVKAFSRCSDGTSQ
jgi:hypothetical protein